MGKTLLCPCDYYRSEMPLFLTDFLEPAKPVTLSQEEKKRQQEKTEAALSNRFFGSQKKGLCLVEEF